MQGKGGRIIWSVYHFVFFLHRRGGHPFLIGICPKGSLIIKKWRSSRTRRLEVMQPRIRIKSELLESRERLWETKARNDQKSNICHFKLFTARRFPTAIIHGGHDFKATKRSEKVVKVRLIKSFLCSEQFKVDIYSISAFGFSREYERFDQVGQVLSLIPWQKLDGCQIL